MTLLSVNTAFAGYGSQVVLHDFTARIEAGEVVILIGANGSGKSTLVRVLAGLHAISHGEVIYAGVALGSRSPIGLAVAPDALPRALTGFHAIELVAAALSTSAIGVAIDYAAAVDLHPRLHMPIASYSLGTRQKLSIALSMVGEPRLLVLDESLNGLDLPSLAHTLRFLSKCMQSSGQSVS